MAFVFSGWYIVLLVLVLAVVGCIIAFVLMDKQDSVIINNFVKETNAAAEASKIDSEPVEVEQQKE